MIQKFDSVQTDELRMQHVADSLIGRVTYLESALHRLEEQRDSVLGGAQLGKKVLKKLNESPGKLTYQFTVLSLSRTIIDPKIGVRAGTIPGFEVVGNVPMRITDMEVILVRKSTHIESLKVTAARVDIAAWRPHLMAGDELHIIIKKIRKANSSNMIEEIVLQNEKIIIPLL